MTAESSVHATSLALDPGPIALRIGSKLLEKPLESSLLWMKLWFRGNIIMVVGPEGAGKTSLVEFLRHGVLGNPDINIPSTTQTEEAYATFRIQDGPNKTIELEVKSLLDTAGQQGPVAHAREVLRIKPHVLVAVLDCTMTPHGASTRETHGWLSHFLSEIDVAFSSSASLRRRLRSIIFVMNKQDKVLPSRLRAIQKLVKIAVKDSLSPPIAKKHASAPIISCCLIESELGRGPADRLVTQLALTVARRRSKDI